MKITILALMAGLLGSGQGQQVPYAENICNQVLDNAFKLDTCRRMKNEQIEYDLRDKDTIIMQKYLDQLDCRSLFRQNPGYFDGKYCPNLIQLEHVCDKAYPDQSNALREKYEDIYFKSKGLRN